jgi:hypothetical protein
LFAQNSTIYSARNFKRTAAAVFAQTVYNLCDEEEVTDLYVKRMQLHVKLAGEAGCVDSVQAQLILCAPVGVFIVQVLCTCLM